MQVRTLKSAAAMSVAGLLALSGCGSGGSESPSATATGFSVETAEQEGTLTWYTSIPTEASNAVIAAFQQKYPKVKVSLLRSTTQDLWQKFQTENAARRGVADVVGFADWGIMNDAKTQKLLAKYVPDSVRSAVDSGVLGSDKVDADGFYFASRELLITIAYNNQTVPAEHAPKTWDDLLDPWWTENGHLGILDPTKTTGTYYAYYAMDQAGIAQSFFSGIARNKHGIKQYDQGGAIQNALSSKEIDAGVITDYSVWSLIQKGQPFTVVYPEAGVGGSFDYNAVAAAAPHPAAARLFADYLGSTDGSQAIAKALNTFMVRSDVPPYPTGKPPISQVKVLPLDPTKAAAQRDDFYSTFKGWMG